MFRISFLLLLVLAFTALGVNASDFVTPIDSAAAVYKIRATGGGHVADGSAVLIAPGRLLTACHVIRGAKTIRVGQEDLKWFASPVRSDIEHDLCLLAVPELSAATPASIGQTDSLHLRDPVIAAGYYPRGGEIETGHGEIKGLHPHDGASVLQVSAPFDRGQSGGGLFDAGGRLIGIIGFRAVAGGDFHYVLPLAWAGDAIPGQAAVTIPHSLQQQAFWERPAAKKPLFLRAASLEANRDWDALHGVAQEWVASDQKNPASWLCLGRTLTNLKRDKAAAYAFEQASALSSDPAEKFPSPPIETAEIAFQSDPPQRQARQ